MANSSFSRSRGSIPLQTVGADDTGRDVGKLDGLWEGDVVGTDERIVVGRDDGGATVGSTDGWLDGPCVNGATVGANVRTFVGETVGLEERPFVGLPVC